MYKNSITHYIAKFLVDIMFYGGIICTLGVPLLAKGVRDYFGYSGNVLIPIMLVLFGSGACCVYILFNLKQMFKTLLGGNPFVDKNVSCFRKMAVSCAVISLIYIVKCFYLFTITTVIITIIFIVGMLFCLTLKDIFKQAICYKEENELTI